MKIKLTLSLLVFSLLLSSCNVFDPFEPNSNHFDRCKYEADKGNYDNAEEECNKALDEATKNEDTASQVAINTELGDIYLTKSGITLKALTNVFSTSANGVSPIVTLVNGIIENANEGDGTGIDADGNKVKGITSKNIEYAQKAMDSFDTAAASGLYSDFAGLMARVCYIALVLAYTDNDGSGVSGIEGNAKLDPEDICTATNCEMSIPGTTENIFCINSTTTICGGMSDTDANKIANIFLTMGDELSSLGIKADIGKSANALVTQKVDLVKCTRTGTSPAECYANLDNTCDDPTEIATMCVNATCLDTPVNTCSTSTEQQTVEWIFSKTIGASKNIIMAGAARKALYDIVKGL